MYETIAVLLGDTPEAEELGEKFDEYEQAYMELWRMALEVMSMLIDVADGRGFDRKAFEALALRAKEFSLCDVVETKP